ncbi:SH3 domain-containing protein [Alicyclobacillus sp. SO9]|uniref:SH3 domain-containing protein n=1 Tax=Alicyclobacillus sp. SO9 TaxID=2665646 RepID=UPI0018E7759E|nr:SH3 domain-containing protein [Alicyclobacillus sp. SO9]QQE79183.1 SH3 domain-containing protein [Alicyclobacillus sp. SO9]
MNRTLLTSTLPNVTESMLSAQFWFQETGWTHRANDKVDASLQQTYQSYIQKHAQSMFDLVELWESAKAGLGWDDSVPVPPVPPSPRPVLYGADGGLLPEAFWQEVSESIAAAVPVLHTTAADRTEDEQQPLNTPKVHPGFSVRRADVRRYPTQEPGFKGSADKEFDRFQDTALHTFEPVLILLGTSDNDWYYIVSTTYTGWVHARDIAIATDEQFREWARFTQTGRPFIIPLANNVYTQANPYDKTVSQVNLEFAAYIPLAESEHATRVSGEQTAAEGQPVGTPARNQRPVGNQSPIGNQSPTGNLRVYLPVRNDDGRLDIHEAFLSAFSPVHFGFRPYTRFSVVESAFRLLSERYGWGDRFGCHDCASFIMDSYRTVGLQLPRDAGQQEEALPNFLEVPAEAEFAERTELLKELAPGDPLYMPGHTMMYLGYLNGHHYMIHDFAGYVNSEDAALARASDDRTTDASMSETAAEVTSGGDGGLNDTGVQSIPVNEIMVSTLDILTSRRRAYIEELTGVGRLLM